MGVAPDQRSERLAILSGTAQNVVGIVIAGAATLGAQVLITRRFGPQVFGVVTVVTQAAFVASFAARAGMDMAVLRTVAVGLGAGRTESLRAEVRRAAAIACAVSAAVALLGVAGAGTIRELFSIDEVSGRYAVEAALAGLPFLALANVWLAATRGLKTMRYTLYIFWAGQPLAWMGLMLAGWAVSASAWMTVAAYSASWALAAAAAFFAWRRESAGWERERPAPGSFAALWRYAGPRAPAALFSQLLFWTDLFVLTRFASAGEVGVYAAVLRAGQVVVLLLTSVNLMFSPYVADLYARGERARLDRLFKDLTRFTLAATLPAVIVLAVAPGPVLRLFGGAFDEGKAALLVVLAGQLVNLATGSAGFVLIMAGRTGWDLAVYAGSLVSDLGLAAVLAARYGMEGAAVANALTFALSNAVRLALVARLVGIWPYERAYLRLVGPFACGLVGAALGHAAASTWALNLALTALGAGLAYGAAYLAFGLSAAERRGLANLLARARGGLRS